MMRLTPQQLQKIKNKFPEQDDNIILLAAIFLHKHLNENQFSAVDIPITTEYDLKQLINKYSSDIEPLLSHASFNSLTAKEAQNLGARLVANTTLILAIGNDSYELLDSHTLQGLAHTVNAILNEKNNPDPEQIKLVLNGLFNKFPETKKITAFQELLTDASSIIDAENNDYKIVALAKDTFSLKAKISPNLLANAAAAFEKWMKNRKSFAGIIHKILELTDTLINKYPSVKNDAIEFCYLAFSGALSNRNFLEKYLAKYLDIITTLITLDDKQLIFTLFFHLANNPKTIQPWSLIEVFDHHAFKKFTLSERRVIFNLISMLLNNNLGLDKKHLRNILNKCEDAEMRLALLQRLNEFYREPPFPPLATFIEWINLIPHNDAQGLATALEANYIMFNKPDNTQSQSSDALLIKQLNKFKRDTDNYALSSSSHTRKLRASYLSEISAKQLNEIEKKSYTEKQKLKRLTIAEWYLQYSTIENASSTLSRTLEKRLIKLMQIPDDDALIAARKKRESFGYKLRTFFKAGRSFMKSYRDKAKDPVHAIIWQHLDHSIKSQISNLRSEIRQLDKLDRLETALFKARSLPQERLEEISEGIAKILS